MSKKCKKPIEIPISGTKTTDLLGVSMPLKDIKSLKREQLS